jgi:hypothetical protein
MVKINARQLWQPAFALVLAIALIVLVQPDSRANRVSTLDLEETGFDELYIQFLDADRGLVPKAPSVPQASVPLALPRNGAASADSPGVSGERECRHCRALQSG